MNRKPGIYLASPSKYDMCNFIHHDHPDDYYNVPATVIIEFDLNGGQYVSVIRVCDEHLAEMHKVTCP